MSLADDPHWYKDAIVYQLHVKAFFDSTNDGIGDFGGLSRKLDYLADLGVTALWLLPFYPSPLKDDGYDIADYGKVNPAYGDLGDFRRFVREAHRRGLRVITELVINHTSDQHEWFQRARRAKPGSAARNFYVWSDTVHKYEGTRIIFCDTETSNWAWDPEAKAYYWHRFFSHQPDLNFDNPRVFEEVTRVMRFWLNMGVDGLRLDAIPYLCEREGTNNENLPETHGVIRRLRSWLDANFPNRMFLGEANQWPEDVRPYFGDGDECHMAFHFPLMPRMYMAVAEEDRHPITNIMRQTPDIPESCQWAVFLRNHDELTLEMVSDRERDYLWQTFAADTRARINLGIRRRLAPLLDNDRRKIELLNGLLMSMPGTPIVYYGDEIGMGDNIFLGDRNGVRTPMQWSPDRNGGFSGADPQSLYLPPIMDPVYGYQTVNVEAQSRSSSSLLHWMRRLIAARKMHRVFGRGRLTFLYPGNRRVLAYLREDGDETILCVANLSRAAQPVELDLSAYKGRVPVELLGNSPFPPIGDLPYFVTLPAYGFFWFLLATEAQAPTWYQPFVVPLPDFETLVFTQGWTGLGADAAREALARRILPGFLGNQRWFAGKEGAVATVERTDCATMPGHDMGYQFSFWDVEGTDGRRQRYLLPLAVTWENRTGEAFPPAIVPFALAKVRRVNRVGMLHDALAGETFAPDVVRSLLKKREIPTGTGGRILFTPTQALWNLEVPADLPVHRMGKEQSNTSVRVGETMVLKVYRRIEEGIHPEVEMGRFLTDVAHFNNVPTLLGTVELISADGRPSALAILQGFVPNQGDGWAHTQDYLDRYLDQRSLDDHGMNGHAVYLTKMETLGQRVAELHRAFSLPVGDPAFAPEAVKASDLKAWGQAVRRQAEQARRALRRARDRLGNACRTEVDALLAVWDRVERRIRASLPDRPRGMKTRYHGDLHLGQVVVVKDDFHILDFEGEPVKDMATRRAKHSPLKDVAGMLRSLDYAAWAALFARAPLRPDGMEVERPLAEQWEEAARESFLKGYLETVGNIPSLPGDPESRRLLLDLFTLEKALYEICYEAANRPDWLRIPVRGVLRLLEPG
jgi:maltose alpha-D-glucosyltransferase/alpha-amylase